MSDDFENRREAIDIDFPVAIPTPEGGVSETVTIKVPALRDPVDGEVYLTEDALRKIDDTKARFMGLLLPQQIKELRAYLALSQREISDLLQIGEKTWCRWESGRERPSRSLNLLLQALMDGQITVCYLRMVRNPALGCWEGATQLPEQGLLQDTPTLYFYSGETTAIYASSA